MNNLSNHELEQFIHDCQIDGNYCLANTLRELLTYREAGKEPVAWTDAEELRDVERGGCGYLFKANPITPHADERRVIKLYTAPPLDAAKINHQSNIHSSADAGSSVEIKQPSSMLNAVPDGWVMVPKEPTDEMCDVSHIGIDVYTGITKDDEYYSTGGKDAAKIYLAMLAAAPHPEETDNTKAQYESLSK